MVTMIGRSEKEICVNVIGCKFGESAEQDIDQCAAIVDCLCQSLNIDPWEVGSYLTDLYDESEDDGSQDADEVEDETSRKPSSTDFLCGFDMGYKMGYKIGYESGWNERDGGCSDDKCKNCSFREECGYDVTDEDITE